MLGYTKMIEQVFGLVYDHRYKERIKVLGQIWDSTYKILEYTKMIKQVFGSEIDRYEVKIRVFVSYFGFDEQNAGIHEDGRTSLWFGV